MKYHFCPICFADVRHPQQTTCGGNDCRDSWKHLNSVARKSRANLATLSPSERELILMQTPEVRPNIDYTQLESDLAAYEAAQKPKESPQFIREMLNPENLPIKEKEP